MFNLQYLNRSETERLHAGWCATKINFFSQPNPLPANSYVNWLYGVGERIFVCSPEDQLVLVNSFYTVLKNSIQHYPGIFEVLTRTGLPSFEPVIRARVLTDYRFIFEWPETTDLDQLKTLLDLRPSQAIDGPLRHCLDLLDIKAEIEALVDTQAGKSLSAKLKKVFDPKGSITISVSVFGIFDEFNGFINTCNEAFNYSKFTSSHVGWGAYDLVRSIGNSVCPYCNRGFTHSVNDHDLGRGRPELDHFLPKSAFPFFAVSLYNLIPVCHTCNHAKSDTSVLQGVDGVFSFSHLHPNIASDDVSDSVAFATVAEGDIADFLLSGTATLSERLTLTGECLANDRLCKSLTTYKLARINDGQAHLIGYYSHHYKDVERLLNMIKRYPVKAIESIAALVGGDSASLQKSFMDVLITDRPGDEPLGKLKNDLLAGVVESWQG